MIYSKHTIKNISESIGIPKLKDGITTAMAQDVEFRLHDLIDSALKFMRHSKRTRLTPQDINQALRTQNTEPMYGFQESRPIRFHRAANTSSTMMDEIYYTEDTEIDLDKLMEQELPEMPPPVAYTAHWLAVEGVQPRIQQNPMPAEEEETAKRVKTAGGMETVPLVKHVLSRELQLYFECIVESLQSKDPKVQNTALESVSVDAGIHQLVMYFVQLVASMVRHQLEDLEQLKMALRVSQAIRRNPNLFVDPYMHQLMPALLTLVVCGEMGREGEDHWAVRRMAAGQVAEICREAGEMYHGLQSRVARTLVRAFLDPTRRLETQYGALAGLGELGRQTVRVLVAPNALVYMELLRVELEKEETRASAEKCKEALVGCLKQLEGEEEELGQELKELING